MAAIGDDCYFFCTSVCNKGAACPFRHMESAKTCKVICQHWQLGGCFRPNCKFRHSDFHIQVNTSEVPCYWESQPVGCSKLNCLFMHIKPRPPPVASVTATKEEDSKSSAPGTTNEEVSLESTQNFIRPLVPPVIIHPESEESNSSPVKKSPADQNKNVKELSETDSGMKRKSEVENLEIKKSKKEAVEVHEETNTKPKIKKIVKSKKAKAVEADTKKVKKVVKGTAKKTAAKVVTPKPAAKPKKIVKKVAKPTSKSLVQRKKPSSPPPRRNVKDRLGVPSVKVNQVAEERAESSDSDDSIENIKVMSMEEIFRQKALESMMKRRAAGGKPMPKITRNASSSTKTAAAVKPKPAVQRNHKVVESKLPSSSEEEDEEDSSSEEDEEEEEQKVESEEEEESSNDSSDSSDSDEDESEDDLDVRRVVVHVDSPKEKSVKKKAKPKLILSKKHRDVEVAGHVSLKKSKQGMVVKAKNLKRNVGALKKRLVGAEMDNTVVATKTSIKDRLGKPVAPFAASDISKVPRRNVVSRESDEELNAKVLARSVEREQESEEKDDAPLGINIKVKTLEEIRAGKMRKLGVQSSESDTHPRLSKLQNVEDGEHNRGRQVLLTDDNARIVVKENEETERGENGGLSLATKKRRPWRTKTVITQEDALEEDERTVAPSSVPVVPAAEDDEYQKELNQYKEDRSLEVSPYEALRQRMLLIKKEAKEKKQLKISENADFSEEEQADPGEENSKTKHKKRKHKHKEHKKSKRERQIYMPPALKKSALSIGSSQSIVEASLPCSPEKRVTASPPAGSINPARKQPIKRVAAAWAAGLSLSSKGTGGIRPLMRVSPEQKRTLTPQVLEEPVAKITKTEKVAQPPEPENVTIKSFSEIMAEKRKKRLEMQTQKTGNKSLSTSSPSKTLSVSIPTRREPKSIGAITPIVFDLGKTELEPSRPTAQPTVKIPAKALPERSSTTSHITSEVISHSRSTSSPFNSGLSQSMGVGKTKLFSKNKNKIVSPISQDEFAVETSKTPSWPSLSSSNFNSTPVPSSAPSIAQSKPPVVDHHDNLKTKALVTEDTQQKAVEAESIQKKTRLSIDDEFSFFDDDEFDHVDVSLNADAEPIDDLLQDIDDLLA